jgi:signal recognition particle subunit SRP54
MLPGGLGQAMSQVGDHEQELKRVEALILSMTEAERQRPDLIDASRKRRIARGSGTEISHVNQLLRQFGQLRDMMKMMGGGKLGGLLGRGLGGMKGALAGAGAGAGDPLAGFPGGMGSSETIGRLRGKVRSGAPGSAGKTAQARKDRKRQKQARKRNRKRR